MAKQKLKLQSLVFDKDKFGSKTKIKTYIRANNYKVDKRLRNPIMSFDKTFRVRQRNPDWFNKKTFKVKSLGKGVKGVFGLIKK